MTIIQKFLITLFVLIFFSAGFVQEKCQTEGVDNLIKKMAEADGAAGGELSYELSKTFVACDSIFLQAMLANEPVFKRWLDDLQYGTFTVYIADDEIEEILYEAMFSKLRSLMIEHSEIYLRHHRLQRIAEAINHKLKEMKIRFID